VRLLARCGNDKLSPYLSSTHRLHRSEHDLLAVARNHAPWWEQQHCYFELQFRQMLWELLVVDKGATLPYDDVRHMIQAWSMIRRAAVE
jgi:hypothetical protein